VSTFLYPTARSLLSTAISLSDEQDEQQQKEEDEQEE
jgi:hypothetical protein